MLAIWGQSEIRLMTSETVNGWEKLERSLGRIGIRASCQRNNLKLNSWRCLPEFPRKSFFLKWFPGLWTRLLVVFCPKKISPRAGWESLWMIDKPYMWQLIFDILNKPLSSQLGACCDKKLFSFVSSEQLPTCLILQTKISFPISSPNHHQPAPVPP